MRIISELESNDCVGGFIKDYKLDCKVNMKFTDYLRNFGQLTVLKDIKQPFYSLDREDYFTIKGLVGSDMIKVIYRPDNQETAAKFLKKIVADYHG
ncbi:MAG: hypothetical protein V1744_06780 [Candidatus Altiarchaeota archaeon]